MRSFRPAWGIVLVAAGLATCGPATGQVSSPPTDPQSLAAYELAQAAGETPRRSQLGKTAPTAYSAGEAATTARINNWTVGIAGGLLEGTFVRFAAELAKALDDGDNLRILPIITYGAAENISDLLYLKGVDVAITNSDALDEYKRVRKAADIERRVNYVSQLYISELHVLARPEIRTMKDLDGKKVGFHTKGAGPTVTAPIVFERLGIKVEPVFINNALAYEQMKTGEIAALVHNAGKPNELFLKAKPEPGFHFLKVEYSEKFADYYVPSELTSQDYPGFVKPGEKVETLGIPALLAVYNWPQGSDRQRRVERFIEYYVARFETLRKPPFHPKWKEVNLEGKVPGWNRYWVVDQVLAKVNSRAQETATATAPSAPPRVDTALARAQAARAAPTDQAEQERLFQQFLEWSKAQKR